MTTNNQQFLPDFFPCPSDMSDDQIEAAIVTIKESTLDGLHRARAEAFCEGVLFERRMSAVIGATTSVS